jgi:hypothetical protein
MASRWLSFAARTLNGLLRQAVSMRIVLAADVSNGEVLEFRDYVFALAVDIAETRTLAAVRPTDLPDHNFGIAKNFEPRKFVGGGVFECNKQSCVFGVVVITGTDVLADLHPPSGRVLNNNAYSCWARITAGTTIHVSNHVGLATLTGRRINSGIQRMFH